MGGGALGTGPLSYYRLRWLGDAIALLPIQPRQLEHAVHKSKHLAQRQTDRPGPCGHRSSEMPPISTINVEFILSWICRKSSKHQPPASVQHQGQSYEPAINRRSQAADGPAAYFFSLARAGRNIDPEVPRIVTIYSEVVPDKIITVLNGEGSYSAWRDIDEVPPAINNQLKYYFLTYKRGPDDPSQVCEVHGIHGADVARDCIERSHADYLVSFSDIEKLLGIAMRG
jgi:hypothetical protein